MVQGELKQIDTPALLVDLDILDRNLKIMSDFFKDRDTALRPHIKTHKTPIIARKQVAHGAIGITCAKLGEAEVMAAGGLDNILIANQVVGETKIRRLVNLAHHVDLTVAVDDPLNVKQIARAARASGSEVGVLIEIEIGMKRSGIVPGKELVDLARRIARSKGLKFRGVMGYEGHCVTVPEYAQRKAECEKANRILIRASQQIRKAGLPVEIVSAGGTGTFDISGVNPHITEVQVGSYVFMDCYYRPVRPEFGISLSVLCSVVSHRVPGRGVVDGGLKTFSRGFALPQAKNCPGLEFTFLSEEHGKVKFRGAARQLKPGDKVEFYTAHCCEAVNLHDKLYGVRKGRLETVWDIAARGKLT